MPTSVFLTTCHGIDSMPDAGAPTTRSCRSWQRNRPNRFRERYAKMQISFRSKGRKGVGWKFESNPALVAPRATSMAGEQVAEGALRSTGKHRALFSRSASGGGWDDERHRDSTEEVSVSGDGCELTRFFYYDTQLEPSRPCATV